MGLSLLLPVALFALGTLLLPLLIHLSRRSELRPTDFAALRWLRAQVRPRHRLHFEDWPLLLLRLLLLTLLVMWLARPVLHASSSTTFVAVMPGVSRAGIDSQTLPANARRHWLAVGLPALDVPIPTMRQPIDSLLRQIDSELDEGAPLIVLATAQFDGADAQRPRLSRRVDWRIVDGAPSSPSPVSLPPPRLRVHTDAAHATALRYLRAAAKSWHADATGYTLRGIDDALPADKGEIVIWLGKGPLLPALQQWIENGGTALLDMDVSIPADIHGVTIWHDESGDALVEGRTLKRGRLLRFTRPLQPQALPILLDADFPQRLRDLLQPVQQTPTRADARAHVPLTGARIYLRPTHDLRPWLALLIALAFAIERWMATRAPRGATT